METVITSPYKCDFYLQSHDRALGTARTAHYIVLESESCYTMDKLEELVSEQSPFHLKTKETDLAC